jgi:very-short-patch-repair endonuclease
MTQHLHLARCLRRQSTDAERRLWEQLRARRLDGLKFRRQVPIGNHIVDFVCFDARLVVEVDGGHHADRAKRDRERTESLEAAGFLVLRFWNSDVMARIEQVVATISETALLAGRARCASSDN